MTVRALTTEFLDYIKFVNAPRTVHYYRTHLERFCLEAGSHQITSIKAIELLKWGKSWHDVQCVQRLFSYAVHEAEYLVKHPFQKVKKPRPGRRKRILSRRDTVRVCRYSLPEFRAFLFCMRESICRPQEVRAMRWEGIQTPSPDVGLVEALREGTAVYLLEEFKGKDLRKNPDVDRVIIFTPRLCRLLLRLAKRAGETTGYIFLNAIGRPWTNNAVRCRMRRLRKRCGLKKDSRGENVVCYTIRHTQATVAVAAGIRDRVLADLMGHSSTRTTARYQHLQVEHLREAMASINANRRKLR